MKNEFIITSTHSIEGEKIEKYLGVINNNIVLGTNLFSDIGASFLDVFGGASNSYQNKLQSIYDSSIQNLKVKAINLGANAILGLSIDFDEISGGNKSMLMISISGTAVIINYKKSQVKDVNTASKKYISNDILKNELTKKHIIKKVRAKKKLVQDEWNFLQQNPISDLSENLIDSFLYNYFALKINSDDEKEIVLIRNFSNYLRDTDPKRAIDKLYKTLPDEPDAFF
ncbi:MAG: YbjQ family protein [Polaribacter sp.]|nr:YbjQ family protein [Polaribacter sp.]